jgi:hypothetical protein
VRCLAWTAWIVVSLVGLAWVLLGVEMVLAWMVARKLLKGSGRRSLVWLALWGIRLCCCSARCYSVVRGRMTPWVGRCRMLWAVGGPLARGCVLRRPCRSCSLLLAMLWRCCSLVVFATFAKLSGRVAGLVHRREGCEVLIGYA